MYKCISVDLCSGNFADIVFTRINSMVAPYTASAEDLQVRACMTALKRLRQHDAMRVVKTWVNSWATTDRYHEAIRLPCIFGCPCKDKLAHYIGCPILFYLTSQVLPQVPALPLERIGLGSPSIHNCKIAACVFRPITL